MGDVNAWIEHLNKPLVLAGFALWLVATLSILLLKNRSTRLYAFWGIFFIGAVVILLSFGLAYKELSVKTVQPEPRATTPTVPNIQGNNTTVSTSSKEPKDTEKSGDTISTSGDNSPAFKHNGSGTVELNYGK